MQTGCQEIASAKGLVDYCGHGSSERVMISSPKILGGIPSEPGDFHGLVSRSIWDTRSANTREIGRRRFLAEVHQGCTEGQ